MNGFEFSVIAEVHKRPALWDQSDENYKKNKKMIENWNEIANILNRDRDEIRIKWRNLRDQFHREAKKLQPHQVEGITYTEYTGKWKYFERLLFLKDIVPNGSTSDQGSTDPSIVQVSTVDEETAQDTPEHDPIGMEEMIHFRRSSRPKRKGAKIPVKPPKKRNILLQDCETELSNYNSPTSSNRPIADEMDEDTHFVLSLVPLMRQLDPVRKLIVRSEINNVLVREYKKQLKGELD